MVCCVTWGEAWYAAYTDVVYQCLQLVASVSRELCIVRINVTESARRRPLLSRATIHTISSSFLTCLPPSSTYLPACLPACLPAGPTHMCMCTLVFSVRSEPAENARLLLYHYQSASSRNSPTRGIFAAGPTGAYPDHTRIVRVIFAGAVLHLWFYFLVTVVAVVNVLEFSDCDMTSDLCLGCRLGPD